MDVLLAPLEGVADTFVALPMFPMFEIIHYIKASMTTRTEPGAREFAFKHPICSLVSTILVACGGTIVCNLLLGLPLGEPLVNPIPLMILSIMWFLVYFCPGDLFYTFFSTTPVKAVVVVLKDMRRIHRVIAGIRIALGLHPAAWALAIVAGTARASGGTILATVDKFMRGSPNVHKHEFLAPSYHTKFTFCAASALVAHDFGLIQHLLPVSSNMIALVLFLTMSMGSLSTVLLGFRDPFSSMTSIIIREDDDIRGNTHPGKPIDDKKND